MIVRTPQPTATLFELSQMLCLYLDKENEEEDLARMKAVINSALESLTQQITTWQAHQDVALMNGYSEALHTNMNSILRWSKSHHGITNPQTLAYLLKCACFHALTFQYNESPYGAEYDTLNHYHQLLTHDAKTLTASASSYPFLDYLLYSTSSTAKRFRTLNTALLLINFLTILGEVLTYYKYRTEIDDPFAYLIFAAIPHIITSLWVLLTTLRVEHVYFRTMHASLYQNKNIFLQPPPAPVNRESLVSPANNPKEKRV